VADQGDRRQGQHHPAARELGASVECNPRFGPKAAETTLAYAAGQTIPPKIINPDKFFDASNAKENIAAAY
jgi:ribose transport system substrate-binding protein